jgi:DNA mismatch repair protein MSH6
MARGVEGNEVATPKPKATLKKASSSQSNKGQRSILGFFSKQGSATPKPAFTPKPETTLSQLTPAPSSDAIGPPSSPVETAVPSKSGDGKNKENGLPSPLSSSQPLSGADGAVEELNGTTISSPTRKVSHYSRFYAYSASNLS